MAYTLAIDKSVTVQASFVDESGNPAAIGSTVAWSSSAPSLLSVTANDIDSTLATLTPVGPEGLAQITASADADLTEGTRTLVATFDVQLISGDAMLGTITVVTSPVDVSPPPPSGGNGGDGGTR